MRKIKDLRMSLNMNMKEAAKALGIPYTTYVSYEKGDREPNSEMLIKLSKFFNVSIDYLIGRDDSTLSIPAGFIPLPPTKQLPVIGTVACGTPILAEQNIEGYVSAPANKTADFALRCKGDSMKDAGIKDGDVVYIHKQPEVENGQIAVVCIDGEATLKRFYRNGDTVVLQPANAAYPPLTYTGNQLQDLRIEGLAVGFTHWF